MTAADKRVVEGLKLPSTGPLTEAERGWIELLRAIFNDRVPAPTLKLMQAIRTASP